MLRQSNNLHPLGSKLPTLWGLAPADLHDRYWASRSICVVRPGAPRNLPRSAELFMLLDGRTLVLMRLGRILDTLCWNKPAVLLARVRGRGSQGYRESVLTDAEGRFVRFARSYDVPELHSGRLALTSHRHIAELWQRMNEGPELWRRFRRLVRRMRSSVMTGDGCTYDRSSPAEMERFVMDLMQRWKNPSALIEGVFELQPGVWCMDAATASRDTHFFGPLWIGAGRSAAPERSVLGPGALWDDVNRRPSPPRLRWEDLTISDPPREREMARVPVLRRGKRLFDIVFALFAMACTLPLYPLIMLAIWLEDGWPFFYAQRRETLGGREFPCFKFRSMRKVADGLKQKLKEGNISDGPQFFLPKDPRVTRVGAFLRKTNLDEIPQFLNVLLGHMSVVGPRPSPRAENQCCPAWRESRLSVRPGITGLWQVSRTRRTGLDFQEWIRWDLQYVERSSLWLDLWIIYKTVGILLRPR